MKLVYWIANTADEMESDCYAVRAKTKKECIAKMQQFGDGWENEYLSPKKVIVEYDDAFDLMMLCRDGEGRGYFESRYGD